MIRRILSVLLCLTLLGVLTITAFCVEVPNMDEKGSISITMTYEGEKVSGGSLTIFHVAQVHVENGADYSFRYTQDFVNCQVSFEQIDAPETAQAIADYAQNHRLAGTTLEIDSEGKIVFPDLHLGLYLLIQNEAADGYELVSPFLVSVPVMEQGSYLYHVDATPKLALEREPTEPTAPSETTTPTEPTTPPPDLPQTGQNQWPVPVMALCGFAFVLLGMMLYTSGKKKAHES